jgi:hypothetical protein
METFSKREIKAVLQKFKEVGIWIKGTIQKQYFHKTHHPFYEATKGKPFWIKDPEAHQIEYNKFAVPRCCLNHIVGLPKKWGRYLPIFDYELDLLENLEKNLFLVINKARGLGITELFLRYMIYLCVNTDDWRGKRIVIATGPDIDLSYDIINRIKNIVQTKFPLVHFDKEKGHIDLCGVRIEAFPSHNIESLRGYTDVIMILLDECDRFPKFAQVPVKYVVEGYRLKNRPYTVWVSTPEAPDGLMARFEKEIHMLKKEGLPTYEYVILNYILGVGKIYDEAEIEAEKLKPYFSKEYDNKFAGAEGNLFRRKDILACVDDKYNPSITFPGTYRLIGVDESGGVGLSGIVALELRDDGIYVLHADDYENLTYSELVDEVFKVSNAIDNADFFYADTAYPAFYSLIKKELEEVYQPKELKELMKNAEAMGSNMEDVMKCIPKNFRNRMIFNKQISLALEARFLHIHPNFPKLITALESATGNDKGKLDKELTSYDDVLDALSMMMEFFDIPTPTNKIYK